MKRNIKFNLIFIFIYSALLYAYGTWYGYDNLMTGKNSYVDSTSLIVLGVIVLIIFITFKFDINFIGYKQLFFLLSFFLLSCLFRANIASDLGRFFAISITYFIVLVFSWSFQNVKFTTGLTTISCLLTITLVISLLIHLENYHVVLFERKNLNNRVGGLFFSGELGAIAGFSVIISAVAIYFVSAKKKILVIICLVISSLILLATDSRNSIAAILPSVIYMFYHTMRKKSILLIYYAIFLLGAFIFVNNYFKVESGGFALADDFIFRMFIWQTSFNGILIAPIWGLGKVNYFTSFLNELFSYDTSDAHSSYLNFLLQFGIIAFIISLLLYGKIIKNYMANTSDKHKILLTIPIYWAIVIIAGGSFLNFTGDVFTAYLVGFSFFGILSHKDNLTIKQIRYHTK